MLIITIDSAVLGVGPLICDCGTVRVIRQCFVLYDSIGSNTFALLEVLPCVQPMAILSGVRSSYRLAL